MLFMQADVNNKSVTIFWNSEFFYFRLHDWAEEEHAEKLTSSYIYKSQLQYSFLPDSKAVEVKVCISLMFCKIMGKPIVGRR